MTRRIKFGLWFAGVFFVIALSLIGWFSIVPGDQLILLCILAMPATWILPFFFPLDTPLGVQELLPATLGSIQYFALGFAIGHLSTPKAVTK